MANNVDCVSDHLLYLNGKEIEESTNALVSVNLVANKKTYAKSVPLTYNLDCPCKLGINDAE